MNPRIPDDVLSETTMQLLASSTLRRYLRVAREYGGALSLSEKLIENNSLQEEIVARLESLSQSLENEEERPAEEAEIALWLVALSDARVPIRKLLERWETYRASGLAWIRALAKRLISSGPLVSEEIEGLLGTFMQSLPAGMPEVEKDYNEPTALGQNEAALCIWLPNMFTHQHLEQKESMLFIIGMVVVILG
jgi:hypothetical protein